MLTTKKPVSSYKAIRKEISRIVQIGINTPFPVQAAIIEGNNVVIPNQQSQNSQFLIHLKNLLGIPYIQSVFKPSDFLAIKNPEILHLNSNKYLIINIPSNYYDTYIHGKSITIELKKQNETYRIISTFYRNSSQKYFNNSLPFFGRGQIAYLFCDRVNPPYNGTINNGTTSLAFRTSWETQNWQDRFFAVSFDMLKQNDYGSDMRFLNPDQKGYPIHQNYPLTLVDTGQNSVYLYDIPVGFVDLIRGFIVITHPKIVDFVDISFFNTNTIVPPFFYYFKNDESTHIKITYTSIEVKYVNSVVCVAMPNEFILSKNPTYNFQANYQKLTNGETDIDPVYITQVGLYNEFNELIAIAKIQPAVKKDIDSIFSFNLEIET